MNNDKYTFMRQHFTSDKKSGGRCIENVCPNCHRKTVGYWYGNENYPWKCAACGESGNVYYKPWGYKNPIEQFNYSDKNTVISRYHEHTGKTHRLCEPALSVLNIDVKQLTTKNHKQYHGICIIRDDQPVKRFERDHNTNKYVWKAMPYSIYGEPKSIWLFDNLIDKTNDTVYIVAGENDAQCFVNKTGIIPISPILGEKSQISNPSQTDIFNHKHVVILFDNDPTGRKGSVQIAYRISTFVKTKSIKIIPAHKYVLGGGSDLDDYFQAGGTWENLQQVIENTPAYIPPAPSIAVDDVLDYPIDATYHQIIHTAIKKNYNLRFNEITNQIEYINLKEKEIIEGIPSKHKDTYLNSMDRVGVSHKNNFKNLEDRIENDIQMSCRNYDELKRLTQTDLRMVTNSSLVKKFNPFLDYFENLDLSDDTDYLKQLCDCITTDKDCESYKNEYLKMWLVGFVAQLFPRIPKEDTWEYIENKYHVYKQIKQKGKNQYCLILQGKQGEGKTDFFEWFANVFGHQYFYSGNIEPDNRDHIEKSTIMAIIHLDELADKIKNHKTLESYKSLVGGAHTVNIRKAYGRHNMTMFRHASFCASINDASDLLNDHSGARRWMILTGVKISQDIYKIDINKLMAQLFKLYIGGFKNWYDDHDFMNKRNEKYQFESIEEQLLLTAIGEGKFKDQTKEYMASAQIGALLLKNNPEYSKISIITLGKLCTKNFSEKKRIHKLWHYNVKKPISDEPKQVEIKHENKEFEIDGIPF